MAKKLFPLISKATGQEAEMSDLNISDGVPKLEAPVLFLNTNNSTLIRILVPFEKKTKKQKKQ